MANTSSKAFMIVRSPRGTQFTSTAERNEWIRPITGIQPLQLVADLSQQVFPPRNVLVGFDTQR
jgi:hypothetical protein